MSDVKRYDLELSDNRCDCGNARSIGETECEHGDYVRHSDHVVYLNEMKLERDAAQSELARVQKISDNYYALCVEGNQQLAALREELAKANKDRETLLKLHVHLRARRSYWIAEETKVRRELTAAEQRNSASEHLLMMWYSENALGRINVDDSAYHVVTATAEHFYTKPTESGASE